MKKAFMCSLCKNGIIGGVLYLDAKSITYKTQKLTVNRSYKNLVLPLDSIKEISWNNIIFPLATFSMKNGEEYKLIIFNKARFVRYYREYSNT